MKLKDYINNKEYAIANEIYNARFNSVENVMELLANINEEEKKFDDIICEFNCTLYNIKVCISNIAYHKERVKKLNDFKSSRVASLIEMFVANQTEENMFAIKEELEKSNDFEIYIVPKWKHGDRERMYGFTYDACFNMTSTQTYYTFDNFDVDTDIKNIMMDIEEWEKNVAKWIDKKQQMYDEHGFDALMPLFSAFEKENGAMKADNAWVREDIIENHKDYYEEDY